MAEQSIETAAAPAAASFIPPWCPSDLALDRWLAYRQCRRSPCRGPDSCRSGDLCDHCQAYVNLAAEHLRAQNAAAPDLRKLTILCELFPDEMRDLLAPLVFDLLEEFHTE